MLKKAKSSNSASKLGDNDNEVVQDVGKVDNKNLSKKSKYINSGIQMYIGVTKEPTFLTTSAKKAFNSLKQMFTKALIFWHFDPECHIRIQTITSSYAIGKVLSQPTSDHLTTNLS